MTAPYYADATVQLHHGDCLDVLRDLPDASVDAVVTDPPYGLEFMGKAWDAPWAQHFTSIGDGAPLPDRQLHVNPTCRTCRGYQRGTKNRCACEVPDWKDTQAAAVARKNAAFQAWCELWTAECLRVLKPGGMMLCFGGTRTFHRLACAAEDAGFEIRDSLAWLYGSGFPKSLNVTKALESLPACACEVPGNDSGVIDAARPSSPVRASVGAEPGAVSLAGLAADQTRRVGAEVVTASPRRSSDVYAVDVDGIGQGLPVVLGPSAVAGTAEGEQVVGSVSGVEVDPEALRDQVVSEEPGRHSAIGAPAVTLDNGRGDVAPSAPLVLPLAATPGGVAGADLPSLVVDGHASAGAVDAGISPAPELLCANGANMDAVSGAPHGDHSTPERAVRCEVCGGVRGPIPDGLGTALKPAFEPVVVARKPLTGTVAANVLAWGTGALNVDGCRVGMSDADREAARVPQPRIRVDNYTVGGSDGRNGETFEPAPAGRWPANVVLDEGQAEALDTQSGESSDGVAVKRNGVSSNGVTGWGSAPVGTADAGGYGGSGGASRFFYVAKADASERVRIPKAGGGAAGSIANQRCSTCGKPRISGTRCECPEPTWIKDSETGHIAHPTVKPLALMRWLVRLVTPPGGVVLEPFAGSGTTVEACILEGFRCIAIEREADYLPLIEQRIHRRRDPVAAVRGSGEDGGLFDLLGEEPA